MKTIQRILYGCVGLALSFSAGHAVAGDGDFTFAVLGDMPYGSAQEFSMRGALAPAIEGAKLPFLIHVGDFKAGDESCTDDLILRRRTQIYSLAPGRVIYTPGDNEWTDCDRSFLDHPRPRLARLGFLRKNFYPTPLDHGEEWNYRIQSAYPENARWEISNLVFATIHVVSSNNARGGINPVDENGAPLGPPRSKKYALDVLNEVDRRDAANAAWLDAVFTHAAKINARAVVIATQADMTKVKFTEPCAIGAELMEDRTNCDGFAGTRRKLIAQSAKFGKPVLLVHGDTNPYCLDKKFGGETAANLWRLNALGDFTETDATIVTVSKAGAETPFTVNRLMTGAFLDIRKQTSSGICRKGR